MVGKVGPDAFGAPFIENLWGSGVNTSQVGVETGASTGCAVIIVDQNGQNSIVLSPGANDKLTEADIDNCKDMIRTAKILLLQFVIPLKTVAYVMHLAAEYHVRVILNPAPAAKIDREMLALVDFLVPNEIELQLLPGMEVDDVSSTKPAGCRLLESGAKVVIVTLGEKGAFLLTREKSTLIATEKVPVVDITTAGDAFIGGLTSGLIKGLSLDEVVRYGCATSTLAVTKFGAQSSLPTEAEVNDFYTR